MKKYITISLFIFILSFATFAQTENKKEESNCPELSIVGPPSSNAPGESITFTVQLLGDYDEDKVAITWTVDKGTITSGQGTRTIRVSTVGLSAERSIATVNVLVGDCKLSGAETSLGGCSPPRSVQIDDFGRIYAEDFRARMDTFIADLQNNRGSQGYVVNYGSKKKIAKREKLIRKHLNFRDYDLMNIVFVNGGKSKKLRTKFWRVPAGADASTID